MQYILEKHSTVQLVVLNRLAAFSNQQQRFLCNLFRVLIGQTKQEIVATLNLYVYAGSDFYIKTT